MSGKILVPDLWFSQNLGQFEKKYFIAYLDSGFSSSQNKSAQNASNSKIIKNRQIFFPKWGKSSIKAGHLK